MFQSKTYLNTDLVWITMLVCLLVDVEMFIVFHYYRLANKITLNFDCKFHNSYLIMLSIN